MKTIILSIIAAGCLALPAAGAKKKAVKQENPFLAPYTAKYGIPPFEKITYADLPHDLLELIEDVILCRRPDAAERLIDYATRLKESAEPFPSKPSEEYLFLNAS